MTKDNTIDALFGYNAAGIHVYTNSLK